MSVSFLKRHRPGEWKCSGERWGVFMQPPQLDVTTEPVLLRWKASTLLRHCHTQHLLPRVDSELRCEQTIRQRWGSLARISMN